MISNEVAFRLWRKVHPFVVRGTRIRLILRRDAVDRVLQRLLVRRNVSADVLGVRLLRLRIVLELTEQARVNAARHGAIVLHPAGSRPWRRDQHKIRVLAVRRSLEGGQRRVDEGEDVLRVERRQFEVAQLKVVWIRREVIRLQCEIARADGEPRHVIAVALVAEVHREDALLRGGVEQREEVRRGGREGAAKAEHGLIGCRRINGEDKVAAHDIVLVDEGLGVLGETIVGALDGFVDGSGLTASDFDEEREQYTEHYVFDCHYASNVFHRVKTSQAMVLRKMITLAVLLALAASDDGGESDNLMENSFRSRFLKYKHIQSRYAKQMAINGQGAGDGAGDDDSVDRQDAPTSTESAREDLDSWYGQIAGAGAGSSKTQNGRTLAKWTFYTLLFALVVNILSVAWYFGCTRRRRSQSMSHIETVGVEDDAEDNADESCDI